MDYFCLGLWYSPNEKKNEKWTSKVYEVAQPSQHERWKQSLCIYCFCDIQCRRTYCQWAVIESHLEEATAQWCLQWDVTTDQKKNVVKLVIKHRVVHKAGSALHPGSYGMTRSLKTAAFSERVAASHAVQKLIDCCSSGVSYYPECNLGKKYRVTGWRLGTPSLVPTARSKALLSRCTWPHTCMTVIIPFEFEPSADSRQKDNFAPA